MSGENPIDWTETGAPRSRRFDDVYFTEADGRAEGEHVFLGANGLPARWRGQERFVIAELGFGVGLNFLTVLDAWRRDPERPAALAYASFELAPPSAEDIRRAIGRWPELAPLAEELIQDSSLQGWPPTEGWSTRPFGGVELSLGIGDANALLPEWRGAADAWFLDGFSPAKNPELWGEGLMRAVFEHTREGGSFATYAAAGWVRRNLQAAGFAVEKRKGFGRKKEMLAGRRT